MNTLEKFMTPVYPKLMHQIPAEALGIISNAPNVGVAVQLHNLGYIFLNKNLLNVYQFQNHTSIIYKKDDFFTENKKLIDTYRSFYDHVIQSESTLTVREIVEPKYRKDYRQVFSGILFPLRLQSEKPNAILSLMFPEKQLTPLKLDDIFYLPRTEILQRLSQTRYKINTENLQIILSRQEIICFIELLKGKQAGEIAAELGLKQVTIESYIQNLKNKCGVSRKSDLIEFFISNHILQDLVFLKTSARPLD